MTDTAPQLLSISQHDDITTLTLNRPKSANALSPQLVEELIEAITSMKNSRLCVIRAEGKHFCAGFDLSDIEAETDADLLWRFLRIEQLLQLINHSSIPMMALAQGQVVGAGADLFAACWQRVAAPNAVFRMPGWNFELALGTRRFMQLVGQSNARDALIDSKKIPAQQALHTGFATEIIEPENWTAAVDAAYRRTQSLPQNALVHMMELTAVDTRTADIAAIVASACRPGLRDRIIDYRNRVIEQRKAG